MRIECNSCKDHVYYKFDKTIRNSHNKPYTFGKNLSISYKFFWVFFKSEKLVDERIKCGFRRKISVPYLVILTI